MLEANDLLSFARRRVEEEPAVCPCDPNDFYAVLAVLGSLCVEAEIEAAETSRELFAGSRDRRTELAARFRSQRGGA